VSGECGHWAFPGAIAESEDLAATPASHCQATHFPMHSDFELIGEIRAIEVIAVNLSIRERTRLRTAFGGKRWRKLSGIGRVRFPDGTVRTAELHWYEAHGVGRRRMKV
jgi:hypothetical protein